MSDTPKELGGTPEDDFIIATEVMGWVRLEANKWRHPQHGDGYSSVPSFSTYLDAAWQVLETFPGSKKIEYMPSMEVWMCVIDNVCEVGKKPAIAICRAALKAVRENKRDI